MLKWGTGWCGWTEAETLDTSMPVIELAYEGALERLCFVSNKPPPKKPGKPGPPATTQSIAAMFGKK